MNYLTRLALQTGLTTDAQPLVAPTIGIEEIEVVTDAPVLALQPETQETSNAETVAPNSERTAVPIEPVEVIQAKVPVVSDDIQLGSHPSQQTQPAAPRIEAPKEDAAPAPAPEVTPEILLQQVMGWVASNEQSLAATPPEPTTAQTPVVEAMPVLTPPAPDAPVVSTPSKTADDIPSLQIDTPTSVVPSFSQEPPAPVQIMPPVAAPPQPEHHLPTVTPPSIIEERIEISIGAIHLDVTPPPPPRAAPVLAAPAPAAPAPARTSPSSRLARRFIRM